jgi:hypothetical protein
MRTWARSAKEAFRKGETSPFRVRHLILEMLVALCLAFLVWLYTRSRGQETLDQVSIPVQVKLAAKFAGQFELEVAGANRVTASFSGPPSRIRELRRNLQRGLVQVAITASVPEDKQNDSTFSDVIRIDASSLPVPPGVVAVLQEEGSALSVTFHRLVERQLPVRLDYAGEYRLSQIKFEPATVIVRGPKEILDRARSLNTQPFTVTAPPDPSNGNETNVREQVTLVTELDGRPIQVNPKTVSFRCKVQPRQRIYELADVPVRFLCPPDFPWRPRFANERAGKVTLRVIGPSGEEPPPVLAFIDLTKGNIGRGRNLEPLRLQLPRDFQLAQETPIVIPFHLDGIELQNTPVSEEEAP